MTATKRLRNKEVTKKKKIALLALLLAFVLCFSLAACQPDNPDNTDPDTPAEKVYKIAVSGNAARTLTTGETDTITWTVTCDGVKVTEEAEVTVGGSAVTLSDKTATSVKITAAQAGNARVTIKLTAYTYVVANVTYYVSKPSFFGNHNGNWAISDTKVSVDGGQSTILTREKGKTWMFSAEVDITDYSSTETIATVYPEGGVGAISISGPATLVPQIVSGEYANGTITAKKGGNPRRGHLCAGRRLVRQARQR